MKVQQRLSVEGLISKIRSVMEKNDGLVFIAISGFAGAGKSTLAGLIQNAIEGSVVVPMDDFIDGPKSQRSDSWETFDRGKLQHDVLEKARPGVMLTYQCYHSGERSNGQTGTVKTLLPKKLVVIEGCGVLYPDLMSYYSYSAWIDVPEQIARERAKRRDLSEGNHDEKLWEDVWGPNDQDYFDRFHPDRLASTLVIMT